MPFATDEAINSALKMSDFLIAKDAAIISARIRGGGQVSIRVPKQALAAMLEDIYSFGAPPLRTPFSE